MLREVFEPDEAPSPEARDRARIALLNRIHTADSVVRQQQRGHGRLWTMRLTLATAAAVVAVTGVVAVENLGPLTEQGGSNTPGLPFGKPAAAAELLENAAIAAGKKHWKSPRPDQFMYKESRVLRNVKALEDKAPNGPLVPGKTRVVVEQEWRRIDAQVLGRMDNGKLVIEQQGVGVSWGQIPYGDLANLTTPEAVIAWERAPKQFSVTLVALLSRYVLPPAVEAAFFRAIARTEGVSLNPESINIDGRPAVGLSLSIEGYLSHELLFDKETYALIGERLIAFADHQTNSDDGSTQIKKGDVLRQAVYTTSIIVNKVGDTK